MQFVRADQVAFSFRPDVAPVLRVPLGEPVRFETSPEPAERLFAAGADWLQALDVRAVNAVTGPVFIEGVAPGDVVAVEILEVQPGPSGFTAAIPGFGMLGQSLPAPMLRRVP